MIFLYNIEQCFPNFSSRSPHQAPNMLEGRTAAGHARGQATHSQGDRMGRACLGFWSEPMLNPVFFLIWFHILHTGYILETGLNDWLSQRSLESINIGLKEQEEFVTSPTKNQIWPTDISALNPVLHFHIFHYGILWPLKSGAGGIHIESPSNSAIFGRFPLQEAWWTWIFAKSAARQVSAASGRITCALATIWWEPWGCHESKKWRGMSDKRW